MADPIVFVVRGLPVPQGALVRSPSGGLYHRDAKRLDAWRTAIADEARDAIGSAPAIDGPVSVRVDFVMPRLRSHFLPANRRRPVPELRADAPVWQCGRPDVDKLSRALLDAITGVVIRDDGQVAALTARKPYETSSLHPGCVIRIERLEYVA